jgi:prepilin-type N-terminal cleavage/methylation domain-containing protein
MKNNGFTLLEVLLSIAAITIIAGISIPIYQAFQNRNNLDIAAVSFAQTARRAQVLSQAVSGDTSWGVYAQSGSITLFKGASFGTRDASYDETFDLPSSMTLSSPLGNFWEVVFTKFTGMPQATGVLTLTSSNNETRNITLNAKGMASY